MSSPAASGRSIAIDVDLDESAWNAYVGAHPEATVAHLWEWGPVIAEAYGHRTHRLAARTPEGVAGVLPLVEVRSRIFGHRLSSMPYLDTGGILAESPAVFERLLAAATELAARRGIRRLELRHRAPPPIALPYEDDRRTLILDLGTLDLGPLPGAAPGAGESAIDAGGERRVERLWKAIGDKNRNQVRKAKKEGLTAERAGAEALSDFYRVWQINMRDLGSPAHRRRWFERIFVHLGERAAVYVVRRGADTIGGLIALEFGDHVVVPWASSDRRYFRLSPNTLLYWTVLRDTAAEGRRGFDFGRSTVGSGTFDFKRRWGATPVPLYWHELDCAAGPAAWPPLPPGSPPPPAAESRGTRGTRSSVTRERAARLWSRLPVPVATWLGGHLRGGITL
jgi:serine/alanine adding enzyme